jgi:predicted DNA-binding transcriptional regulator YafY
VGGNLMSDRLIRLLRIIILIQAKPGILARELAERCDTTDRTIYRDLDLLSASYIPITNNGHSKGYSYISNFSIYPLDWTDYEAMTFAMLPSILEQVNDLLPGDFYAAYEKVMASFHKEKNMKKEFLDQVIEIIQMGTPAYQQDKTNFLSPVMQAILAERTIEATYHSQGRNETTRRLIDPYYLTPRDHRFYLIGYCHEKKQIRTFRLSRFRQVNLLDLQFKKGDFKINTYLKNTWSIERGEKSIRFKILFSPKVARYIKEEELFVSPRLTDRQDGSLLFEVTVNHDREILQWLMQYGPDAEILKPVSYRDRFKEMLQSWTKLYQ